MNFNIFRNFIAFKSLSFIGYLNIIFIIIFHFITIPEHLDYRKINNINQEDDYFLALIFGGYVGISIILFLFFIIFAIFEYFVKKENNFYSFKQAKCSVLNNTLFWLGIIFSAMPIYYFFIIFITMYFF